MYQRGARRRRWWVGSRWGLPVGENFLFFFSLSLRRAFLNLACRACPFAWQQGFLSHRSRYGSCGEQMRNGQVHEHCNYGMQFLLCGINANALRTTSLFRHQQSNVDAACYEARQHWYSVRYLYGVPDHTILNKSALNWALQQKSGGVRCRTFLVTWRPGLLHLSFSLFNGEDGEGWRVGGPGLGWPLAFERQTKEG